MTCDPSAHLLGKRKRMAEAEASSNKLLKISPSKIFNVQIQEVTSAGAVNESQGYFSSKLPDTSSLHRITTSVPIEAPPQRAYLRIRKPLRERDSILRSQSMPSLPRLSTFHELTIKSKHVPGIPIVGTCENQQKPETVRPKNSPLAPCHICYKSPKMRQDLNSYTDCMSCHERACFICVRSCEGGYCQGRTICSKCCVEEGEDGRVICFGCLAVRDDVVMEG